MNEYDETRSIEGSDDEIANEIAAAFMAKFTDNSVNSKILEKISRSEDAKIIISLPSSKVWIVPMASITIETFYAIRFMCLSLQEFTDMITFGSINELMQVYSTLNLRTDAHISIVIYGTDVEYRNTFVYNHPSKFIITSINPKTETIITIYDLIKRRIYAYIDALIDEGPCLSTPLGSDTVAQARSLAFSREFWVTNIIMNGVPAKS